MENLKIISVGCSEYPETIFYREYLEKDKWVVLFEFEYFARSQYDKKLISLKQYLVMCKEFSTKENWYYNEELKIDALKKENQKRARFTYKKLSYPKSSFELFGYSDNSKNNDNNAKFYSKKIKHNDHDYTLWQTDEERTFLIKKLAEFMCSH